MKRKTEEKKAEKAETEPKTITLGAGGDDPIKTICLGHVSTDDFNKAMEAEGWKGDRIRKSQLRFRWYRKTGRKWKEVEHDAKGSQPVTVLDW